MRTDVQRRVSREPPLVEAPCHERGDGEGERHREPDKAQVQKDRMESDQRVVLQERVRARTRRAGPGRSTCANGFAGPAMRAKKKTATQSPIEARPSHERIGRPLAEHVGHRGQVPGEDERPEQDRALERRPHAGDGVQDRRLTAVVRRHESDREVVDQAAPAPWRWSHRTAPASTQRANVRACRNSACRPVARPTPIVTTPDTAASRPSATPISPRAAFISSSRSVLSPDSGGPRCRRWSA